MATSPRNDEGRTPDSSATDPGAWESGDRQAAGSNQASSADDADVEEIRRRAYERWVARGDGPGSEHDDWLDAEREVREARSASSQAGAQSSTRSAGRAQRSASSSATSSSSEQGRSSRGDNGDDMRASSNGGESAVEMS